MENFAEGFAINKQWLWKLTGWPCHTQRLTATTAECRSNPAAYIYGIPECVRTHTQHTSVSIPFGHQTILPHIGVELKCPPANISNTPYEGVWYTSVRKWSTGRLGDPYRSGTKPKPIILANANTIYDASSGIDHLPCIYFNYRLFN